MPEPRPRTPAQIEASRRNGARSHGPVTPEGRARSSRNALKHGLCAMEHLVLEGEVPEYLEALIAHLTEEVGAASEIEARLARRLAIAFWKGERAERIEVALFDAAPRIRPPVRGPAWEEADPLTTFDVRRFNAIRSQQAQIGREIRSCLAELRTLRKDALACTDEPEDRVLEEQNCTNELWHGTREPGDRSRNEPDDGVRNEPAGPSPANDDAAAPAELRYTPDEPVPQRIAVLRASIMAEHAARFADPERDPAIMERLMEEFAAAWAEVDPEFAAAAGLAPAPGSVARSDPAAAAGVTVSGRNNGSPAGVDPLGHHGPGVSR